MEPGQPLGEADPGGAALRRVLLPFVAAMAWTGCFLSPGPKLSIEPLSEHPSVIGCWRITTPGWDASPGIPGGGVVVVLDSAETFGERGEWRLIRPAVPDPAGRGLLSYSAWGVEARSGKVFMVLGDGYAGLNARLRVRQDRLEGRASTFSDTPFFTSRRGDIEAVRVECPGTNGAYNS